MDPIEKLEEGCNTRLLAGFPPVDSQEIPLHQLDPIKAEILLKQSFLPSPLRPSLEN